MTQVRAPDVVVVGGGIVGCATAAFLAAAGARVTLVEQSEVASGASGRNSGVVQHPFDPSLVGLYRRSLELYRDLGAALPEMFQLDDEPSGLLLIGPAEASPEAVRIVDAWSTMYPEAGPSLVEGPALVALEPGVAEDLVACRIEVGYPVAPSSATRGYARLAEHLGATIVLGERATLATDGDTAIGVAVEGRLVPGSAVVIAAGPWTADVIGGDAVWPPIASSWGVVASIGLERPPRHVLEEIDIEIEPGDGDGDDAAGGVGFGFSLVTAEGTTALGSTFLPEPPEASAALERLRERGARYVPAIARATVAGMRACARPVTPDGRPLIGAVPGIRGAFVAAGNGPWGISTGPGTARLVADLVLERSSLIPPELDAARFPRSPA